MILAGSLESTTEPCKELLKAQLEVTLAPYVLSKSRKCIITRGCTAKHELKRTDLILPLEISFRPVHTTQEQFENAA